MPSSPKAQSQQTHCTMLQPLTRSSPREHMQRADGYSFILHEEMFIGGSGVFVVNLPDNQEVRYENVYGSVMWSGLIPCAIGVKFCKRRCGNSRSACAAEQFRRDGRRHVRAS